MNAFRLTFYSIACLALVSRGAEAETGALSAKELASQLSAIRQDGNSYVRMRMEVKSSSGNAGVYQLQSKERRTKGGSEVVYQVLWPKERKGAAVLLQKQSGGGVKGALLTPPDAPRALGAAQLNEGLFGSDLSYADIIENFFAWDSQSLVGTEAVGKTECQILESKPGKGDHSHYSSVRSWIDARRLVPMRVEKYGPSGKLECRIDTTNVEKDDLDRYLPAGLTIRRGNDASTTTIEGSRIKHGVNFGEKDFTSEGLGDLTIPRS